MKKILTFLFFILGFVLVTSCAEHSHEASQQYSYDGNYHWYSCNGCSEAVNKEEHTLVWSIQSEATCKSLKVEVGICECGYSTTKESGTMLEHSWNDGVMDKVSSCGEEVKVTYICINCGDAKYDTKKVSHTENWSEWVSDFEATCNEKGQQSRVCLDCGETETKETPINPNKHFYGKWEITKNGNCSENGERQRVCSDCQYIDVEVLDKDDTVHNFMLSNVIEESTCGTKGKALYVCSGCNEETVMELEYSDNHNFITNSDSGVSKCTYCGELVSSSTVINNTGVVINNRYDLYLDGDFEINYEFTSTDGGNENNWHNWCLLFLPATYEGGKLVSIELEKEQWGQSLAAICPNGKFKAFIEEHNGRVESYILDGKNINNVELNNPGVLKDGNWKVNVTRKGLTVTVKANMESREHDISFVITFDMPTPLLNLSLSGENNKVTLKSIKMVSGNLALLTSKESGTELLSSAITFTNAGGREYKGYTVSLNEGDFDIEYQFVNRGSTGSDWHNFYYNLYAGITDTGLDSDNVLWAFAANNNEPDWGYTFAANNLRGTTGRAGYGWNYKYAAINTMTNATCYVRITRINGVISVTGHAYQNGKMITSFCFVGASTFNDTISMRLMSENCSIDLKSIKLYNGSLA